MLLKGAVMDYALPFFPRGLITLPLDRLSKIRVLVIFIVKKFIDLILILRKKPRETYNTVN